MLNRKKTIILELSLSLVLCFWMINGVAPLIAADEPACDCPGCENSATDEQHSEHVHSEECESTHSEEDHDEHAHEEDGHGVDEVDGDEAYEEDAHAGHDHSSHEDGVIHLSYDEQKLIGVEIARAGKGEIPASIKLSGQVRLNDDNLAHLSALTPGIVRKVNKSIGANVKTGDILAWIESVELGQAKVEYLDILAEVGCCKTLLKRAKNVQDNTLELIEFLQGMPTLEELRNFESFEMGENRSKLVKAYAELVLASSVHKREKDLFNQKISSKQEYLDAENVLKKAEAEYIAVIDMARFQVQQDFLEESANSQRMELALKGAERKLYILGQSKVDIEVLAAAGLDQQDNGEAVNNCPDPNCDECRQKAEQFEKAKKLFSFERLGWYPLQAPFDGVVIEKHITSGERLGEERSAFTVADLSTVWIDMDVYPQDQNFVDVGQQCLVIIGGKGYQDKVNFVSPVLDVNTRTAIARVVIDNGDGKLRPGLFVSATIYGKSIKGDVVVPRSAIQTVEGKKVVFVSEGEDFEMRPIILGTGDRNSIEILSGVAPGEKIVISGAFDLKAKIVTSTLDSHAGHGH